MELKLGGQFVRVTERHLMLKIGSLFLSAGKIYDFPDNSPGVGINQHIVRYAFDENKIIVIQIQGREYEITPTGVVDIIEKYKSIKYENGSKLYIIPIKMLKRRCD